MFWCLAWYLKFEDGDTFMVSAEAEKLYNIIINAGTTLECR